MPEVTITISDKDSKCVVCGASIAEGEQGGYNIEDGLFDGLICVTCWSPTADCSHGITRSDETTEQCMECGHLVRVEDTP